MKQRARLERLHLASQVLCAFVDFARLSDALEAPQCCACHCPDCFDGQHESVDIVPRSAKRGAILIGPSSGVHHAEAPKLGIQQPLEYAVAGPSPTFRWVVTKHHLRSLGGNLSGFGCHALEVECQLLPACPEVGVGLDAFPDVYRRLPDEAPHLRMCAAFRLSSVMPDVCGIFVPMDGRAAGAPFGIGVSKPQYALRVPSEDGHPPSLPFPSPAYVLALSR